MPETAPREQEGSKRNQRSKWLNALVAVLLLLGGFLLAANLMGLVQRKMASESFGDRLPILLALIGIAIIVFTLRRRRNRPSHSEDE